MPEKFLVMRGNFLGMPGKIIGIKICREEFVWTINNFVEAGPSSLKHCCFTEKTMTGDHHVAFVFCYATRPHLLCFLSRTLAHLAPCTLLPIMNYMHVHTYIYIYTAVCCCPVSRARLAVDVLVAEAQAEDASRASRKAAREVRMKNENDTWYVVHQTIRSVQFVCFLFFACV